MILKNTTSSMRNMAKIAETPRLQGFSDPRPYSLQCEKKFRAILKTGAFVPPCPDWLKARFPKI